MTDTVHGTVPAILDAEAAASAPSAAPQVPPVLPSERLVRLAELTAAGADALDHAADRAPLPGDARGLRPGTRPLTGNAVTRLGL